MIKYKNLKDFIEDKHCDECIYMEYSVCMASHSECPGETTIIEVINYLSKKEKERENKP